MMTPPPSPAERLDVALAAHPDTLFHVAPAQDAYSLTALSVYGHGLGSKGQRVFNEFFHIESPHAGEAREQHATDTNRRLREQGRYFDGYDAKNARAGHPVYI